MRFLPWWQGRHISDPAGNRLARFRNVLEAALTIPVYEASLRAAGIDGKRGLHRITDIESVLRRIGVVNLDQIRVRGPRGYPTALDSPLPLVAGHDLSWNSDGCAVLRDQRAVLIRTGLEEGLFSPIERDGLWLRYGMPMFEHLSGLDGELLAWECEAHAGLHVVEENVVFELVQGELLLTSLTDLAQPTIQVRTGWSARMETEVCDCGRQGRRLRGLRQLTSRMAPRTNVAMAAHT
jgi:hypothetical protein